LTFSAAQVRSDPEPVPIAVAERLHGLEDGEDIGMGKINVMGTPIDLHQTKAERKALRKSHKRSHSWVTSNDKGDHNPEMKAMRKDIKEGVLAYGNYMDQRTAQY
jgi:hypothetical protein